MSIVVLKPIYMEPMKQIGQPQKKEKEFCFACPPPPPPPGGDDGDGDDKNINKNLNKNVEGQNIGIKNSEYLNYKKDCIKKYDIPDNLKGCDVQNIYKKF